MKSIIFHHNDHDGRMSGFIMYQYFETLGYEPVITREVNYGMPISLNDIESGDKVAIVDFSMEDAMIEAIEKLTDRSNIIWIDHHETAIERFKSQDSLAGIRYVGKAGCELCWLYTQGYRIKHDGKLVNVKTSNGELEFVDINDVPIPDGIRLIGDWDMWRLTPTSRELMYGIKAYWTECELTTVTGYNFWNDVAYVEAKRAELIEKGYVIQRYEEVCNIKACKDYAYPCKLTKFQDFKCVAINSNARSSLVFQSVHNDYEIGIVFTYNPRHGMEGSMTFSIYRLGLNKDKDIDVSFIAKSYGGGGHHDAAGFSTNGTLPFFNFNF